MEPCSSNNPKLSNVLSCICKMESPTRAKIAQHLSLSRTTLSSLVKELFRLHLVVEAEGTEEEKKNGRPGVILSLDPDTWFSCGAAFDQNAWTFVLTNLLGTVVYKNQIAIDEDPVRPISPMRALEVLVVGLKEAVKACPGRVLPMVGIGVPGYINRNKGTITYAYDVGWSDVHVSDYIKDTLGFPVDILNRHMTAGLAESRIGEGKAMRDMVYLGISTGLITCNFCNGEFLFGQNCNQGEIGHTIIDPNGSLCSCGKRGCLQTVASQTALFRHILEHYGGESGSFCNGYPTLDEIYHMASEDPGSVCAFELRKVIEYIAIVCSNLINMYNPDRIVIGGPVSSLFKGRFRDELIEKIQEIVIPHPFSSSMIRMSTLMPFGSAIGAAFLVSDKKLQLVSSCQSDVMP